MQRNSLSLTKLFNRALVELRTLPWWHHPSLPLANRVNQWQGNQSTNFFYTFCAICELVQLMIPRVRRMAGNRAAHAASGWGDECRLWAAFKKRPSLRAATTDTASSVPNRSAFHLPMPLALRVRVSTRTRRPSLTPPKAVS